MLTHANNHMLVNNLFPLRTALTRTASSDPPYALLDEAGAIICTLQRRTLRFRETENFGLGHTVVVVGPGLVATPALRCSALPRRGVWEQELRADSPPTW